MFTVDHHCHIDTGNLGIAETALVLPILSPGSKQEGMRVRRFRPYEKPSGTALFGGCVGSVVQISRYWASGSSLDGFSVCTVSRQKKKTTISVHHTTRNLRGAGMSSLLVCGLLLREEA